MLIFFIATTGIMFVLMGVAIWFCFVRTSIEGITKGPLDHQRRETWIAICRRGGKVFEIRSDGSVNNHRSYRGWYTSKKPVSESMHKKLDQALEAHRVFSLKDD